MVERKNTTNPQAHSLPLQGGVGGGLDGLVFATNNKHKLTEVRSILGEGIRVLSLADIGCHDDIPENADTLEGNALEKAGWVYEKYGMDCFADDTGLEVDALGGAPGVHTARYATEQGHDAEANTRKLLREMSGVADRRARFRTSIALLLHSNGGRPVCFDGIVEGEIATEKRGTEGFGYDPVFIPHPYSETFAELGVETKNKISHRARAVAQLNDYLKKLLSAKRL